MKIIPAIDILDGKCVRLTKGDYSTQKIYNENPLEVALELEANGIKYLHVVDLDGAKSKHIVNSKVLQELATRTQLDIDFGGGIKSEADVKLAFDCGARQITLGSIAVDQPDTVLQWLDQYGAGKIILGADCKDRLVATHGWLEHSSVDVISFISQYASKGFTQVICTDVAKDGMLEGASVALYEDILSATNIQLIASGGVSSMQDIEQLKAIGCAGVIVGKAIYENRISLKELATLC
jgi:phosphoribosylformimino-5-aminoimidazole carboxamide ribotide isomerase